INAGVKAALAYQSAHEKGTIGVFATAGTVASDGYPKTLRTMAKQLKMEEPVWANVNYPKIDFQDIIYY
ncbi:MAG: hypothetical protein RLZZ333_593, partial [Bacteroidota bacterium]